MLACAVLPTQCGAVNSGADRAPPSCLYNPHPAPSGLLALETALSGTTISSEGLDERRRRLLLRAWRRGMRETDLIIGPLCRRAYRHADRRRACRVRAPARRARPGSARLGDRRIRDAARDTTRRSSAACAHFHGTQGRAMKADVKSPAELLRPGRPLTLAQVADGAEGLVLADLARAIAARRDAPAISLAVICRDGQRMAQLSRALSFFGPDIVTMEFPAWDCLPYDRVSPNAGVVAQRMTALSRLARVKGRDKPSVLLTTVNAAFAARAARASSSRRTRCRSRPAMSSAWPASSSGWSSTALPAPRPCASPANTRCAAASSISFRPAWTCRCGSISSATRWRRSAQFDAQTQRSEGDLRGLDLVPVAEFQLVTETIRRFRTGYVAQFGAAAPGRSAVRGGERRPALSRHGALAAAVPRHAGDAVRLSARHAAGARASGGRRRARALHADRRLLRGAARRR